MNWIKRDRGSITLEASLALPFFVAFVIVLIVMVKMAMFQMALQSAVNESVKQIATHAYPAYVLKPGVQQSEAWQKVQKPIDEVNAAWNNVKQYEDDINELGIDVHITKDVEEYVQNMVGIAQTVVATPIVRLYADTGVFTPEEINKITVSKVTFYDDYLGMQVEYPYQFSVPFFSDTIVLRAQAMEKLWGQEPQAPKEEEYTLIGTINSDKYHIMNGGPVCIGENSIHDENIIKFKNVEDAVASGYQPCKICYPQN